MLKIGRTAVVMRKTVAIMLSFIMAFMAIENPGIALAVEEIASEVTVARLSEQLHENIHNGNVLLFDTLVDVHPGANTPQDRYWSTQENRDAFVASLGLAQAFLNSITHQPGNLTVITYDGADNPLHEAELELLVDGVPFTYQTGLGIFTIADITAGSAVELTINSTDEPLYRFLRWDIVQGNAAITSLGATAETVMPYGGLILRAVFETVAENYYFCWDIPVEWCEATQALELIGDYVSPFVVGTVTFSAEQQSRSANLSVPWHVTITPYDVKSNVSWMTITDVDQYDFITMFTINVEENTEPLPRTGNIRAYFSSGVSPRDMISVIQNPRPIFGLSGNIWRPAANASSADVTVTSGTIWTVHCDEGWLTTDISSGSGVGSFRINAEANTGNTDRTGIIFVTETDVTHTIAVRQAGADTLTLSRATWSPASETSTAEVNIIAPGDWTVESDAPEWLVVDNESGNGSGAFKITATANSEIMPRRGTITVTCGSAGAVRAIAVTQAMSLNAVGNAGWTMFFDDELNHEIYVTSSPVDSFGDYRNVYMGMTRDMSSGGLTGHLYVLNGDNRLSVGDLTFTEEAEPLSEDTLEPFSLLRNIYQAGRKIGQFAPPDSILREAMEYAQDELVQLQRDIWFSFNKPAVGDRVFEMTVQDSDVMMLTLVEIQERFGQDITDAVVEAADNAIPLALAEDGSVEPMAVFEVPIVVVVVIAGVTIIVTLYAIHSIRNLQHVDLNPMFEIVRRPFFSPPSIILSPPLITAQPRYEFSEGSLDTVWQSGFEISLTPAELETITTAITADVAANFARNRLNRRSKTPDRYIVYVVRREGLYESNAPFKAEDVIYVGRTTQTIEERESQHQRHPSRKFWRLEAVQVGLKPEEAFVYEQALIANFAITATIENRRRAVSPDKFDGRPVNSDYEDALRMLAIRLGIDQAKMLEFMHIHPLNPLG
ncbi:MAG: hypothetical protein FWE27_01265 [Defluviitaleaceae bacterium]|nr:hypothetical protein [Defluviitaleaceae bacterium]